MNVPLLLRVKEQILAEPERFDMDYWENNGAKCGTTRCIAGWAMALSGQEIDFFLRSILTEASALLGLNPIVAAELFFDYDVVTAQQGADLIDAFILKHGTPEEIVEAQLLEKEEATDGKERRIACYA